MTIEEIFKLVEEKTDVKINDKTRKRKETEIRYMAFYLAYVYADGYNTDFVIADKTIFDRCTIYRAINVFPDYLMQNEKLKTIYYELKVICSDNQKKINKELIELDKDMIKRKYLNLKQKYLNLNNKYVNLSNKLKTLGN